MFNSCFCQPSSEPATNRFTLPAESQLEPNYTNPIKNSTILTPYSNQLQAPKNVDRDFKPKSETSFSTIRDSLTSLIGNPFKKGDIFEPMPEASSTATELEPTSAEPITADQLNASIKSLKTLFNNKLEHMKKDYVTDTRTAFRNPSACLTFSDNEKAAIKTAVAKCGNRKINEIEGYESNAKPKPKEGIQEELGAARELLYSINLMDFTFPLDDTFFLLELLHSNDALSPSDLKSIMTNLSRQSVKAVSIQDLNPRLATLINQLSNKPKLQFSAIETYLGILNKDPISAGNFRLYIGQLSLGLDNKARNQIGHFKISAAPKGMLINLTLIDSTNAISAAKPIAQPSKTQPLSALFKTVRHRNDY